MTQPIGPLSTQTPPAVNVAGVQPISGGVGSTPTTMASASQQAPEQIGYVETAVRWLVGKIVSFFKMICCCFFKEETPVVTTAESAPAQLPQQTPTDPTMGTSRQAGPAPSQQIQAELALLAAFERLSEEAQNLICARIGQEVYKTYRMPSWKSYEAIGREAVGQAPFLLRSYLNVT